MFPGIAGFFMSWTIACMTQADAQSTSHPYAALTPDVVLDALAAVGLAGDGRLMALGSYENRVYQVGLEDGSRVVAKFYRPGRWSRAEIREEHAFAAELTGAEVPVVAPLVLGGQTLHEHGGFAFSVSPWRGGRPPELDDFEVLEWLGRFLARLHTVGSAGPFAERPAFSAQAWGEAQRDWLLAHEAVAPEVRGEWQALCVDALALIAPDACPSSATGQFGLKNASLIRVHGDCHPGNVLWTPAHELGGGPHFVDLDDARMGPAVQDLWMLVSGDAHTMQAQLAQLLEGYRAWCDFDPREQRLIEPLRALRMLRHSAWLALRHDDPAFPAAFPFFGTAAYWSQQTAQLREQIELIAQAA